MPGAGLPRGRPISEVCVWEGAGGWTWGAGLGAQSIPESSALQVQVRSTGHSLSQADALPPHPRLHLRGPTTRRRALTCTRDGWAFSLLFQPQGPQTQAAGVRQGPSPGESLGPAVGHDQEAAPPTPSEQAADSLLGGRWEGGDGVLHLPPTSREGCGWQDAEPPGTEAGEAHDGMPTEAGRPRSNSRVDSEPRSRGGSGRVGTVCNGLKTKVLNTKMNET